MPRRQRRTRAVERASLGAPADCRDRFCYPLRTMLRGRDGENSITRLEHQLSMAQRIAGMGSWEWNPETGAVTWSDELYRIYGLEPRSCEITFDSFLVRVVPEDRDRIRENVGAALAQRGRFAYSERITRPDGSMRELETVGEVVEEEEGRGVRVVGACRDVTEERKRDETVRLYADIVHYAQIPLSVWEVSDPSDVGTIRLLVFNPAAERAALRPLEGHTGRSFRELFPYAAGATFEQMLLEVARDGRVREGKVRQSRNPNYPTRALAMKAFPLPGKRVGMAVDDITAETQVLRLQEAEQKVLEMIAAGADLSAILTELIVAIEDQSHPAKGSVLVLDESGTRVKHAAAPHLPEAYTREIDGALIGPAAGSCGAAAYLRRPVFVDDIETDPKWADFRHLALRHGLRACWSTPILATDGRVLGTFALYYSERRLPREQDRDLISRATHLAGIAIERRQLEDQLRALSARVESIREDERTGIAREIHDELGQALTALKMDVAWIMRRISADSPVPTTVLTEKLKAMAAMTDDTIGQVRRISAELRPGVLDDLGLFAALEWQAQEFERRTGTICAIHSNMQDIRIDRDRSTALFRIFQEALTNIARHANAKHVDVRLDRADSCIQLAVHDDGKGISPNEARGPSSLGLLGIRERARRLGGTAKIEPTEPRGTLVSVSLPFGANPTSGESAAAAEP